MINSFRLMAAALMVACCQAAMAQMHYRVTDLGVLSGYSASIAAGLNDRGEVVGYCSPQNPDFNQVGFVWRNGVMTNLGKVKRGNYSFAHAINSLGRIVGEGDNGSIRPEAITFSGGSATIFDSGANNSRAIFVAENGTIVGNYAKGFGGGGWNPVIWSEEAGKPGRFKRLFLPHFSDPSGNASYNYANGANSEGQVVGQVSSSLWSSRGGLWNNNSSHSLTLLEPLPGEWDSYAYAINGNGTIVGNSDVGIFSMTPVMWSADPSHTVTALPLPNGENYGIATGINNLNQIIGFHGPMNAPALWINGQFVDPNEALDASSVGWTISGLSAINNIGQIVGVGGRSAETHAVLLTPVP